MGNINTQSSINIPQQYITLTPTGSQQLFMQDFNPNNRIYDQLSINIQWNYRNINKRAINEGINQWQESGQVIIHKNEIIPQYGDLIVNPWDQWRYYMITNVESHIKEYFFLVDINRVNYTINTNPTPSQTTSQSQTIPPRDDNYTQPNTNPFY